MESVIIRINLILSIIYVLTSFFSGGDYRSYLITAIILFSLLSISMLSINYFLVKTLLKAKVGIVKEDMVKRFIAREKLKKVIDEQEELKEELLKEREKLQYSRLYKRSDEEEQLANE